MEFSEQWSGHGSVPRLKDEFNRRGLRPIVEDAHSGVARSHAVVTGAADSWCGPRGLGDTLDGRSWLAFAVRPAQLPVRYRPDPGRRSSRLVSPPSVCARSGPRSAS
jgi:hypothetical protein